ncbi:ComEA family DNA-binding protein [bacterium]|nr:ComEA family DNA-binding protein [candidate division CSSED10-310 bacterium]
MRFTRLQLLLLGLTVLVLASGILYRLKHQQPASPLVETSEKMIEEVSAGYTYAPIAKKETILDLEKGNTTLFNSSGHIKVNLNSSSIDELCRLPGIGRSTALRILEYRLENGPLLRVDEIDNVKGIGAKTIEKFGDQAYAGDPDPLDHAMLDKLVSEGKEKKKEEKISTIEYGPCGPGRININTATAEELISLPRIGAKTAERILADRAANGPFKDVNDLTRVKGIGPKTLEKMKDRICAE